MKTNLDIIVVDDNEVAQKQLISMLSTIENCNIVETFTNPLKAIEFVKSNSCDVVFLDIEMPELSGIELVQSMRAHLPQVVFYTSNPEYALECYDYNVTDFLKKPVTLPRLLSCIDRIEEKKKIIESAVKTDKSEINSLFIKTDSRYVKLDFDEILYVEASGDYVVFKTTERSYIVHSTMKNIGNNLPKEHFIKVHRSYIVNKDKIVDIEDMSLMIGRKVIPISRSQREPLMNSLNLLK